MWNYNKLWKLLIDKAMLKKDLAIKASINASTIAKMGKNMPVSMDVLGRICEALECNICDIVDYVPVKEAEAR
ncbi:MAG: helix-turn-helix transcriptional regulator [bacterium]|nr:helix-turn-helix transcriptional regulator [bacterium]